MALGHIRLDETIMRKNHEAAISEEHQADRQEQDTDAHSTPPRRTSGRNERASPPSRTSPFGSWAVINEGVEADRAQDECAMDRARPPILSTTIIIIPQGPMSSPSAAKAQGLKD